MRKGSITIFSLLSMMLMVSALLALLEAGRFQELNRLAHLQTQVELESIFAAYNTCLWEDYKILACELGEVSNGIMKVSTHRNDETGVGMNLFQFMTENTVLEGYTRLTDGDGTAYIQAVTDYMEKNLLYETIDNIYNQHEIVKDMQENSQFDMSVIDKVLEEMEKEEVSIGSAGKRKDKPLDEKELLQENNNQQVEVSVYANEKNLFDTIKEIQEKGILRLVVEDLSDLSEKEIDISQTVSNRELADACNPNIKETEWYDNIVLQQYLMSYMSNYMEDKGHTLSYELEYLLGGKETEVENMKMVVYQLLGIRETANFLYLMKCPTKVEQARLLAVAMVGASLNSVLIEAVKLALLSVWAFAESILDIRTLLTGGKIALLKSDTFWTMDINYISTIGEGYAKAKDCEQGLSYVDYLGMLLLFEEETELAKRSMDVQELTLRERYQNDAICLDDWITNLKVSVEYSYHPVFFTIESILPYWEYRIEITEEYGY